MQRHSVNPQKLKMSKLPFFYINFFFYCFSHFGTSCQNIFTFKSCFQHFHNLCQYLSHFCAPRPHFREKPCILDEIILTSFGTCVSMHSCFYLFQPILWESCPFQTTVQYVSNLEDCNERNTQFVSTLMPNSKSRLERFIVIKDISIFNGRYILNSYCIQCSAKV